MLLLKRLYSSSCDCKSFFFSKYLQEIALSTHPTCIESLVKQRYGMSLKVCLLQVYRPVLDVRGQHFDLEKGSTQDWRDYSLPAMEEKNCRRDRDTEKEEKEKEKRYLKCSLGFIIYKENIYQRIKCLIAFSDMR